MSGALRRSASQSVLTSQGEGGRTCAMEYPRSDRYVARPVSRELRKRNPHPPVLFAFLFDLRHAHVADLVRRAHVGAAAGLQVVADDLDEPHPAGANGWLD